MPLTTNGCPLSLSWKPLAVTTAARMCAAVVSKIAIATNELTLTRRFKRAWNHGAGRLTGAWSVVKCSRRSRRHFAVASRVALARSGQRVALRSLDYHRFCSTCDKLRLHSPCLKTRILIFVTAATALFGEIGLPLPIIG